MTRIWSGIGPVVAALLLMSLIASGCARDPAVERQRHLDRGLRYAAEGRHNEAIIELKNALQIDREFRPALLALGRAYKAKSWLEDAARELKRAVDLAPDDGVARADLGQVYLDLEAWKEAQEQGEALRAKDAANVQGLYLVGAALHGKRQSRDALPLLVRALEAGETSVQLHKVHGDVLVGLGRPDEAEAAYRQALARDPRAADALVGLGWLFLGQAKREAASELLQRARALEPGNPRVRLALSALSFVEQKVAAAIQELEALPRQAWSPRVALALGELYMRAGRFEESAQLLVPLSQRFADVAPVRYFLGHTLLRTNRAADAVAHFQEVVKLAPDNPFGRYSLGVAYVRAGQAVQGLKELEGVAKPFAVVADYYLQLGQAHRALGRWESALNAVDTAHKLAPASPLPWGLRGTIHTARGDLRAAEEAFAKAVDIDPTYVPGHFALAYVFDIGKRPEAALREYEAALRIEPAHFPSIAAKIWMLVAQRRLDEALRFATSVVKDKPDDVRARVLLGDVREARGESDLAERAYRDAVRLRERYTPARLGLARVLVARKNDAEAVRHLDALLRDRPAHLPAALLLASLNARQLQYDRAIAVLEAAARGNPSVQDLALPLADLYLKTGRTDEALASLVPIVQARSDHVPARLFLGLAHLARHDADKAIEQFRATERLSPKLAGTHYFLARAHFMRGDREAARQAYARALQIDPDLALARLELAAVSGQKPDGAFLAAHVEDLRKAVATDGTNVALRYTLARSLLDAGRRPEAEAELERVLRAAPFFAAANHTMALLRLAQRRAPEAVEHLHAVVRANPSHVDAHLLLAGLLEQRRQREQAILHLESALRLDPRLHGTRVSLANLYGQTGQLTKAVAYAREAVAAIPKRAEGHVVLGNLYLQQRRTVEALDAFRTALRLRPNLATAHFALGLAHHQRREVALAAAAYRKAMALAPNDWRAHNNLAQLYAEARQNLDEALALATRASEFAPEDPSTLDTLGWVHYVAGAHAKAEPPLRKAVELARSNATFRYHLGMVYYRVGRGDEARSALMQAVLLDPALGDAPDVRAALAKLRE